MRRRMGCPFVWALCVGMVALTFLSVVAGMPAIPGGYDIGSDIGDTSGGGKVAHEADKKPWRPETSPTRIARLAAMPGKKNYAKAKAAFKEARALTDHAQRMMKGRKGGAAKVIKDANSVTKASKKIVPNVPSKQLVKPCYSDNDCNGGLYHEDMGCIGGSAAKGIKGSCRAGKAGKNLAKKAAMKAMKAMKKAIKKGSPKAIKKATKMMKTAKKAANPAKGERKCSTDGDCRTGMKCIAPGSGPGICKVYKVQKVQSVLDAAEVQYDAAEKKASIPKRTPAAANDGGGNSNSVSDIAINFDVKEKAKEAAKGPKADEAKAEGD